MNYLKTFFCIIFSFIMAAIIASTIFAGANHPHRNTNVPEVKQPLTKEQQEEQRRREQLMWIIIMAS